MEDQAFSPSCALTAPSLSPVSKLDGRHTGRRRKRDILLSGGGGRGIEPNHTTAGKPGPLCIRQYTKYSLG
jgi:hypothetical protein